MEKNNRNNRYYLNVIYAITIFFLINIIASYSLTKFNFDFTDGNVFTISKQSKKILKNIEEPINLTFFYSASVSNGIPILKSYSSRIRGILEDYEKFSNGKITLKVIDPKPYSKEEELALSYGIEGFDIDQFGTKAFIGLVATNSVDETKILPIIGLEKEKNLEYEITRIIYDLNNLKRKKVGLISSIKMASNGIMGISQLGGGRDILIINTIKQIFDVENIELNIRKIPNDIDVLMVVQPKNFSENLKYAIDQYVLKGGKAIFFADPNKEYGGTGNPEDRSFSNDFNELFEKWGINIDPKTIILDRKAARKFNKTGNEKETWNVVNYLPWLNLKTENLNSEHITTNLLNIINVNSTGLINKLENDSINFEPLITSNKESSTTNVSQVRPYKDPEKLLKTFQSDNKEKVIAANISGKFKSAFNGSGRDDHIKESVNNSYIIVVADTDILMEDNWSQKNEYKGNHTIIVPIADNASFVLNSLEYLTGSTELLSLRGKQGFKKPFTVVEEIRRKSEEAFVKKQSEIKQDLAITELELSKLQKLAQRNAGNAYMYKAEQQVKIQQFTRKLAEKQKELRKIKGDLRSEIEELGTKIKIINIWIMPIIVILFSIVFFYIKKIQSTKIYTK